MPYHLHLHLRGVDIVAGAVDHTWVTTYDIPPIYDPETSVPMNEYFWYCHGVYHPDSRYSAANAPADLRLAICIARPRDPDSNGTIAVYGRHGVCHQVANQILYATGTAVVPPLTAKAAKGYKTSVALYGVYGTNGADMAFFARVRNCLAPSSGEALPAADRSVSLMTSPADDAISRRLAAERRRSMEDDSFSKSLGDPSLAIEPEKARALLALRDSFRAAVAEGQRLQSQEAQEQNLRQMQDRIEQTLKAAQEMLSPAQYEELFDLSPEDARALIDLGLIRRGDAEPVR